MTFDFSTINFSLYVSRPLIMRLNANFAFNYLYALIKERNKEIIFKNYKEKSLNKVRRS